MSSKKKCDKLTRQQREFCHLHFDNPNLTGIECVHRAYPGQFSTSASASAFASRLLNSDKIQRYMKRLSDRVQARVGASIGRTLKEEAVLAFWDPAEILDPITRELKPLDKIPEHLRRAISKIRIIRTQSLRDPDMERTEYRYTFVDKGAALGRIERILGMYEKDNLQAPEKPAGSDKWVLVPTDRELSLKEWSEQVEELNEYEAAKKERETENA